VIPGFSVICSVYVPAATYTFAPVSAARLIAVCTLAHGACCVHKLPDPVVATE